MNSPAIKAALIAHLLARAAEEFRRLCDELDAREYARQWEREQERKAA